MSAVSPRRMATRGRRSTVTKETPLPPAPPASKIRKKGRRKSRGVGASSSVSPASRRKRSQTTTAPSATVISYGFETGPPGSADPNVSVITFGPPVTTKLKSKSSEERVMAGIGHRYEVGGSRRSGGPGGGDSELPGKSPKFASSRSEKVRFSGKRKKGGGPPDPVAVPQPPSVQALQSVASDSASRKVTQYTTLGRGTAGSLPPPPGLPELPPDYGKHQSFEILPPSPSQPETTPEVTPTPPSMTLMSRFMGSFRTAAKNPDIEDSSDSSDSSEMEAATKSAFPSSSPYVAETTDPIQPYSPATVSDEGGMSAAPSPGSLTLTTSQSHSKSVIIHDEEGRPTSAKSKKLKKKRAQSTKLGVSSTDSKKRSRSAQVSGGSTSSTAASKRRRSSKKSQRTSVSKNRSVTPGTGGGGTGTVAEPPGLASIRGTSEVSLKGTKGTLKKKKKTERRMSKTPVPRSMTRKQSESSDEEDAESFPDMVTMPPARSSGAKGFTARRRSSANDASEVQSAVATSGSGGGKRGSKSSKRGSKIGKRGSKTLGKRGSKRGSMLKKELTLQPWDTASPHSSSVSLASPGVEDEEASVLSDSSVSEIHGLTKSASLTRAQTHSQLPDAKRKKKSGFGISRLFGSRKVASVDASEVERAAGSGDDEDSASAVTDSATAAAMSDKSLFPSDMKTRKCKLMLCEMLTNSERGFKWNIEYSDDPNLEAVNVYRSQALRSKHGEFLPHIRMLMYPTVISTLPLPISASKEMYTVDVRFAFPPTIIMIDPNRHDFAVETDGFGLYDDDEKDGYCHVFGLAKLEFNFETTVKQALEKVISQLPEFAQRVLRTDDNADRLLLKVCGREEYLWYLDDIRVMSSSYVRHLVRHGQVEDLLSFAVMFVADLDDSLKLTRKTTKKVVKWFSKSCYPKEIRKVQQTIPYENEGFACITTAMSQTLANGDRYTRFLWDYVEGEYKWQMETVPSVTETAQRPTGHVKSSSSVYELIGPPKRLGVERPTKGTRKKSVFARKKSVAVKRKTTDSMGKYGGMVGPRPQTPDAGADSVERFFLGRSITAADSVLEEDENEVEIDWDKIDQESVRLNEFAQPVEIKIKFLRNLMCAPRFSKKYRYIVVRLELMISGQAIPGVAWDMRFECNKVTNNIEFADECSTFSSMGGELFYDSLPRECCWCFTVYGVSHNHSSKKSSKKRGFLGSWFTSKTTEPDPKTESSSSLGKPRHIHHSPSGSGVGAFTRYEGAEDYKSHSSHHSREEAAMLDSDEVITVEVNDTMVLDDLGEKIEYPENDDEESTKKWQAEVDKLPWVSEPLVWCRLPMIDDVHCLTRGPIQLTMWEVPTFEVVKGGPKHDPYGTGFWKKFGPCYSRRFSEKEKAEWFQRTKHMRPKTKHSTLEESGLDDREPGVILEIEFPHYPFDIVAPIVNERHPKSVAAKIKVAKKKGIIESDMDMLARIVRNDGITLLSRRDKMLVRSYKDRLMVDFANLPTYLRCVNFFNPEERMSAYDYLERWQRPDNPEDGIELLRHEFTDNRVRLYAINCLNRLDDHFLSRYLLQLVQCLKSETHHDSFLTRFLIFRSLQNPWQIGHFLFWHLKSEYSQPEWRVRFGLILEEYFLHLVKRDLMVDLYIQNRLMIRLSGVATQIQIARDRYSPERCKSILRESLSEINREITQPVTLPIDAAVKVRRLLVPKCRFMNSAKVPLWLVFKNACPFSLPIASHYGVGGYCPMVPITTQSGTSAIGVGSASEIISTMGTGSSTKLTGGTDSREGSATKPLSSPKKTSSKKKTKKSKKGKSQDPSSPTIEMKKRGVSHKVEVMFKSGDDLRQDILTLQMIYIMDEFWLRKNLDLRLKPYTVVATDDQIGMLEPILNATTANEIHTQAGQWFGSFNQKTHLKYLHKSCPPSRDLIKHHKAMDNYARSVCGYSVATWVLGIGDRHPSNIMIHENGTLFHIDFGHFLGNFKSKKIGIVKFEREKTPFVFTPMMKYAIDKGSTHSQEYGEFLSNFVRAFTEIRLKYKMFLNLFILMVPSHMPELIRDFDTAYVRRQLKLDIDQLELKEYVDRTVNACLADKNRLWDNTVHAVKHG